MRIRRLAGLALLIDALPSVLAIGPVRTRLAPAIAGYGDRRHIALSFDDGPNPQTTPMVLAELRRLGIRATFVVLGASVAEQPALTQRILQAGHELALHGWTHRPQLLRTAFGVVADLRRGYRVVRRLTGVAPRIWRPPHGIPTLTGLATARYLGMSMVLWGADGREWTRDATELAVTHRLVRMLRPGATVLLHDAALASPPDERVRLTLAALTRLVEEVESRGWQIGPIGEHGIPRPRAATVRLPTAALAP